jgi:CHAD domain-containing protein
MSTVRTGTTHEGELKLRADSLEIEQLTGEEFDKRTFTSVYYDTDDLRLLRLGLTLRRRLENGRNEWQLTLPRAKEFLQIEELGGPAAPPERIAGLLRTPLRGGSVGPVATLRTLRSGRTIAGAPVTLDQVEVLEGSRVIERFTRVEAEPTDGGDDLGKLERRLRSAGARPTNGRSTLEELLEPRLISSSPGKEATSLKHLQAYLRAHTDRLIRNDPSVRVGDDAEAVHQMRVSVRRLRAALRVARPMLDQAWAEWLRAELKWLGGMLGPVRDVDVFSAIWNRSWHRWTPARPSSAPGCSNGSRRSANTPARRSSPPLSRIATSSCSRRSRRRQRRHRPVRRTSRSNSSPSRSSASSASASVRSVDEPSSAALHKLRIRVKRARYAAELSAGQSGRRARRFVDRAKKLQDTLGEHQDAIVAEQTIREWSPKKNDPDAAITQGQLIERQHERRAAARDELPNRWKRLNRAGKRLNTSRG